MKVIVTLIALFVLSSAAWTSDHQLTGDASIQIAEGVKNQLYNSCHIVLLTLTSSPTKKLLRLFWRTLTNPMTPREPWLQLTLPPPTSCSPCSAWRTPTVTRTPTVKLVVMSLSAWARSGRTSSPNDEPNLITIKIFRDYWYYRDRYYYTPTVICLPYKSFYQELAGV